MDEGSERCEKRRWVFAVHVIDKSQCKLINVNNLFMLLSVENAIVCSVDKYQEGPIGKRLGLLLYAREGSRGAWVRA